MLPAASALVFRYRAPDGIGHGLALKARVVVAMAGLECRSVGIRRIQQPVERVVRVGQRDRCARTPGLVGRGLSLGCQIAVIVVVVGNLGRASTVGLRVHRRLQARERIIGKEPLPPGRGDRGRRCAGARHVGAGVRGLLVDAKQIASGVVLICGNERIIVEPGSVKRSAQRRSRS